jgi:hypothetical protein
MTLLLAHKTLRTSAGQTLHSILVEVLLYTGFATTLVVGCQLEDTCYQCCFILTGRMCFAKVVVADAAIAEAPALTAHVPADEGALLLAATPPELLFLVRSVAA